TMGGGLILLGIVIPTLLWGDLTNLYVWTALVTTMLFGLIGFWDDWSTVSGKNTEGLSPRKKLLFQTLAALAAAVVLYVFREVTPVLKFPFFKDWALNLGVLFIPFAVFIIVGAS